MHAHKTQLEKSSTAEQEEETIVRQSLQKQSRNHSVRVKFTLRLLLWTGVACKAVPVVVSIPVCFNSLLITGFIYCKHKAI